MAGVKSVRKGTGIRWTWNYFFPPCDIFTTSSQPSLLITPSSGCGSRFLLVATNQHRSLPRFGSPTVSLVSLQLMVPMPALGGRTWGRTCKYSCEWCQADKLGARIFEPGNELVLILMFLATVCRAISIHMFPNLSIDTEHCRVEEYGRRKPVAMKPTQIQLTPRSFTSATDQLPFFVLGSTFASISHRQDPPKAGSKGQPGNLFEAESLERSGKVGCVFASILEWKESWLRFLNYGWQVLCTLINNDHTRNLSPWMAKCPSLTWKSKTVLHLQL